MLTEFAVENGVEQVVLAHTFGIAIAPGDHLVPLGDVHDFPNLFFLVGLNGKGLQSALDLIEPAADFAVRTVAQLRQDGIVALGPTQAAVDAFTRVVRDRFKGTTHSKGCTSWWSEPSGHNHSIWPGSSVEFRELFANLELKDFDVIRP